MDESQYWLSFEKGTAIAANADVTRACVLAIGTLVTEVHQDLHAVRADLSMLRNDPKRRGDEWTRKGLQATIELQERAERRLLLRLNALRVHESRLSAELSRLAPQRESTARLLADLTNDYEAPLRAAAMERK